MLLGLRIFGVVALLGILIYCVIINKKRNYPAYFKCAIFGFASQFMAALYYLAFIADASWDYFFSIGLLGELSHSLFVLIGNLRYLNNDETKTQLKFSFKAFICAFISFGLLVASMVINHSLGSIFSCLLLLPCVSCVYSCVLHSGKSENKFNNSLRGYNVLIAIAFILSPLLELLLTILLNRRTNTMLYVYLGTNFIYIIVICVAMLILIRGLKSWKKQEE